MTKEKLITKQQLRIHELEEAVKEMAGDLETVQLHLICVGGGLNDNMLGYTPEQMKRDLFPMLHAAESGIGKAKSVGITND